MSIRLTRAALLASALLLSAANPQAASAARGRPVLPDIRLAPGQAVPACVTPSRLNRLLLERTPDLEPRFRDIARYYKQHGESLRVRWDYAFYQMLLETNYLSFKTGSGRPGDVKPRQNNFAGIGTTGGGVPGDSFPDVSTGVMAQMQHLVAYSGERVQNPLAPRTREKQDDIVEMSRALRRKVRFDDLTNRWAADRNYAASIEWVAEGYRQANCTATGELLNPTPGDVEEQRSWLAESGASTRPTSASPMRPPSASSTRPRVAAPADPSVAEAMPVARPDLPSASSCDVYSASYGGHIALLIRSEGASSVSYTVLQVDEEQEQPQADAFMKVHAPNGRTIARFPSPEPAFVRAFELCPGRTPGRS
jgi:hypothetical protein